MTILEGGTKFPITKCENQKRKDVQAIQYIKFIFASKHSERLAPISSKISHALFDPAFRRNISTYVLWDSNPRLILNCAWNAILLGFPKAILLFIWKNQNRMPRRKVKVLKVPQKDKMYSCVSECEPQWHILVNFICSCKATTVF